MTDKYLGLSPEEFTSLNGRYRAFQDSCDDPNKDIVKVNSPISEENLAHLALVREISKDLAKKKDEDMKKAAQKAAEMEEKSEENAEDSAEEKKSETEK